MFKRLKARRIQEQRNKEINKACDEGMSKFRKSYGCEPVGFTEIGQPVNVWVSDMYDDGIENVKDLIEAQKKAKPYAAQVT